MVLLRVAMWLVASLRLRPVAAGSMYMRKARNVVGKHGHSCGYRLLSAATAGAVLSTALVVAPCPPEATAAPAAPSTAAGSSQDPLTTWMEQTATQLSTLLVGFAARVGAPQQVQDMIRRVIVDLVAVATGWQAVDGIVNIMDRQRGLDSRADIVLQNERVLFNKINAERLHRGLPALQWDDDVAASSVAWADHLVASTPGAQAPALVHETGSYYFNHAGELLFGGQGSWVDANRAFAEWMKSPGHEAALMYEPHRFAGVGIVQRGGKTVIVVRLADKPGRTIR